jgi:hypothetical protein
MEVTHTTVLPVEPSIVIGAGKLVPLIISVLAVTVPAITGKADVAAGIRKATAGTGDARHRHTTDDHVPCPNHPKKARAAIRLRAHGTRLLIQTAYYRCCERMS